MAKLLSISTILLLYERVSLATLACLRENQKLHWRNTAADAGGDKYYIKPFNFIAISIGIGTMLPRSVTAHGRNTRIYMSPSNMNINLLLLE